MVSHLYLPKLKYTIKPNTRKRSILTMSFSLIKSGGRIALFAISWSYCSSDSRYVIAYNRYTSNRFKGDFILKSRDALIFLFVEDLIKNTKNKGFVYSHTFSKVEGRLLLGFASRYERWFKSVSSVIKDSRVLEVSFSYKGRTLIFRDSFNLFFTNFTPLVKSIFGAKLAGLLPVKMYSLYVDYTKLIVGILYNSRLLYQVLLLLNVLCLKEYNCCISQCMTLSSMAIKIFRLNFYTECTIFQMRGDSPYSPFFREAYKGGITEVYKPYGRNLYYYDTNSAYGDAMANCVMPLGNPEEVNPKNLRLSSFFGYLEVIVEVGPTYIPFLGSMNKHSGTYEFVSGVFRTIVFSEELKYALTVNDIKILEVKKAYRFDKGYPFKDYVNSLYNKRYSSAAKGYELFYKGLLNMLSGRFGIKQSKSESVFVSNNLVYLYDYLYGVNLHLQVSGEKAFINYSTARMGENWNYLSGSESFDSVEKWRLRWMCKATIKASWYSRSSPQIAAAITSYARISIDRKKRYCLSRGIDVLYSDTDSIITDKVLTSNSCFSIGSGLGELRLVDRLKEGVFVGTKAYAYLRPDGVIVIKQSGLSASIRSNSVKKLYAFFLAQLFEPLKQETSIMGELLILMRPSSSSQNLGSSRIKPTVTYRKRRSIYRDGRWVETEAHHSVVSSRLSELVSDQVNRSFLLNDVLLIFIVIGFLLVYAKVA